MMGARVHCIGAGVVLDQLQSLVGKKCTHPAELPFLLDLWLLTRLRCPSLSGVYLAPTWGQGNSKRTQDAQEMLALLCWL